MSDKRCPSEAELLSFVDADLPPEQLGRIEKHLELCSTCARQVIALTTLVGDVAAPLPDGVPLDVAEHLAGVMQRLDTPQAAPRWSRFVAWSGGLAVAAALLLSFLELRRPAPLGAAEGELVARGGPAQSSLSRDIGVQLYAQEPALVALGSGSHVTARSGLTAGLRNLAGQRAYLLLFAIDAAQAVHWIAPQYLSAGENPAAVAIAPSQTERLLPSAAVFDDLALGPLRVVAVISREPLHVSDVEALPSSQLDAAALLARFPRAEVRQFLLDVHAEVHP